MRKEERVLNDDTTMMIEHTTGRCDITITTKLFGVYVSKGIIKTINEHHEEKVFYWIQLENGEWIVRLCVNGFCYNSVELNRTMTKKDAIQTVIDRHTSEHWYNFGEGEEIFTTEYGASLIAKVVSKSEQKEIEYIREYDGQHLKAYPNGYVFECADIEEPKNTIKTEEEEAENDHFVKQMTEEESKNYDKCLIDDVNFSIFWSSEIMFHVYMNDKYIGHGEICRSKLGFMYECEEYIGFIHCDTENLDMEMKRKKIMYRMLEYYEDVIAMRGGEKDDSGKSVAE